MFSFEVNSWIKLAENKLNFTEIVKMFQAKSLVVIVILLFVWQWQHTEAAKLTKAKSIKRYDEGLQTDIYETIDDDVEMLADATTIYPPLIEEPSNSVSIEARL